MSQTDWKAELARKTEKLEIIRKRRRDRNNQEVADWVVESHGEPHDNTESAVPRSDPEYVHEHDFPELENKNGTRMTMTGITGQDIEIGETPYSKVKVNRSKLSISEITQTNIPAREKISYGKGTQTSSEFYDINSDEERGENVVTGSFTHSNGMTDSESVELAVVAEDDNLTMTIDKELKMRLKSKDLTEEDKQRIVMSSEFQTFIDKSCRIMQKVLSVENYEEVDNQHVVDQEKIGKYDEDKLNNLVLNGCLFDEKWTKDRCVTSLDWSAQHIGLLAAGYSNNEVANDPDGICLVWNTNFMKSAPEFIFQASSPVTSTVFARFHPNLILGGTYSGSIVMWDNRVNKRTPVQRSPLSTSTHTHPVYCLNVIGTHNSHSLMSISTDGQMCCWSLDMLSHPQETLKLRLKHGRINIPTSPTCFSLPNGSVNNFLIGNEDGVVYSARRHGAKHGVTGHFEGHFGPVTGIDHHNVSGLGGPTTVFSHLFLTSSFDSSVKLWSQKETRPLYSFEVTNENVYDVAWSHTHPAVFASVDGTGKLDIWNLNNNTELPTRSVTAGIGRGTALNKISWSKSGRLIAGGDESGSIWLYDVDEKLAIPGADEWELFGKTLTELKMTHDNQFSEDFNESKGQIWADITETY